MPRAEFVFICLILRGKNAQSFNFWEIRFKLVPAVAKEKYTSFKFMILKHYPKPVLILTAKKTIGPVIGLAKDLITKM